MIAVFAVVRIEITTGLALVLFGVTAEWVLIGASKIIKSALYPLEKGQLRRQQADILLS